MHIEHARSYTQEYYAAMQKLVPLLGAHKIIPTQSELETMLTSNESTLLLARHPDANSPIVGMLTISIYHVPTGIRSIVEDVVVDMAYRGKGIAKALLEKAIQLARENGAAGVSLTSNPSRIEANKLYVSVGFDKRKTNAYYYKIK